ncbi:MAG TPA: hypothetical protein VLA00_12425 [Xanthobacteraceae bacterium]|nr:hypothetical protein [Xanthobacteraceae bacterium]
MHEEGARDLQVPFSSEVASAREYYLLIHGGRLDDPRVQGLAARPA